MNITHIEHLPLLLWPGERPISEILPQVLARYELFDQADYEADADPPAQGNGHFSSEPQCVSVLNDANPSGRCVSNA